MRVCVRVEDWRADFRLRWVFHRFRGGPQSGCHHHVSSPRHIERSVRISRTTLTCLLRAVAYGTYPTERAFRRAKASAYSTSLSLSSLRHSAYLPVLVLRITGRVYQCALASHTVRRVTNSRAPWLRGHYPASQLLRTRPTPSRLRPLSRCPRLYGLPCSADFATGRGGSLQLLSASLSPCRR
jgi:hypothetical protein